MRIVPEISTFCGRDIFVISLVAFFFLFFFLYRAPQVDTGVQLSLHSWHPHACVFTKTHLEYRNT